MDRFIGRLRGMGIWGWYVCVCVRVCVCVCVGGCVGAASYGRVRVRERDSESVCVRLLANTQAHAPYITKMTVRHVVFYTSPSTPNITITSIQSSA